MKRSERGFRIVPLVFSLRFATVGYADAGKAEPPGVPADTRGAAADPRQKAAEVFSPQGLRKRSLPHAAKNGHQ